MRRRHGNFWIPILICNFLLHYEVLGTPVFLPQFLSGGTGRNIRHLPCVSRKTGETGVCMFAFTCAKANGTHLGTCIDRFYFGSCCKIDDEPDIFPQDNTIDIDNPALLSKPFTTTTTTTTSQSLLESNDIPGNVDKIKTTSRPMIEAMTVTTKTTDATTLKAVTQTKIKPSKITTKKPIAVESTTEFVKLSTFQTVQNASEQPTATLPSTTVITKRPQRPSFSDVQSVITTLKPTSSSFLPSTNSNNIVTKPNASEFSTLPSSTQSFSTNKRPTITTGFTKRPVTQANTKKPEFFGTTKPSFNTTTHRNVSTSTTHKVSPTESPKPVTIQTSTQRIPSVTRFPPRNATTVSSTKLTKPQTIATTAPTKDGVTQKTTTTRKPTTTKKPTKVTTKRPSTVSKRPSSTTSKRPSVTTGTTISSTSGSTVFNSTFNSTLKNTTIAPVTYTSTNKPSVTVSTKRPSSVTKRPIITSTVKTTTTYKRPTTIITKKNFTSTLTPRPTTITSPKFTTTTRRPTTHYKPSSTVLTSQPSTTHSTVKFTTKTSTSSTTARPTTTKKYSKPVELVTIPTVTTQSTTASTTANYSAVPLGTLNTETITHPEKLPTSTSSSVSSTSQKNTSTTWISSTVTTLVNENDNEIDQTTITPGIVTWTSFQGDDDDNTTKASEFLSTLPDTTEAEWTPITTPDGWIIIQSPTTEKVDTETSSEIKTVAPSTTHATIVSVKPTTESTTTTTAAAATATRQTTTSTTTTTLPTTIQRITTQSSTSSMDVLSTIATVTVSPEFTDTPFPPINMSNFKEVCGRRLFPESRIVGGDGSTFGKWPWQISLRQWRTSTYLHKCGAALLNENWAITAAHCVQNVLPSDLLLRIGEHDLGNEEEPYSFQERRVQIVASHPNFDPRTFEFDLALMRFYEPVLPFQPNVLPICVPDDDEDYVGQTAYVTGWGRLYEDGPLPSVLQEVAVPVINNSVCEGMYRNAGYIEHIPHIFICAGWRKGGFDSCEGDSGGPLVIQRKRDKRWVLAGVISWGIGCAEPNQPGVYTRISEFREWINQILQF